ETLPALRDITTHFEDLPSLRADLMQVLSEFYEKLVTQRESRKHFMLIQEVRDYIARNYANPDLSLLHLSDEFEISAKYLSKLFKEEFGDKFIDYLADV